MSINFSNCRVSETVIVFLLEGSSHLHPGFPVWWYDSTLAMVFTDVYGIQPHALSIMSWLYRLVFLFLLLIEYYGQCLETLTITCFSFVWIPWIMIIWKHWLKLIQVCFMVPDFNSILIFAYRSNLARVKSLIGTCCCVSFCKSWKHVREEIAKVKVVKLVPVTWRHIGLG